VNYLLLKESGFADNELDFLLYKSPQERFLLFYTMIEHELFFWCDNFRCNV